MIEIDDKIINFLNDCEKECKARFDEIDSVEFQNQLKVLNAFNKNKIQSYHFIGSSGYGHNDIGKEKLSAVFADIFHTESAFVSPLISCGTEAISQSLLGILRPNDCMLCISGTPYDTLKQVIYGVEGKDVGSLKDYHIKYHEVDLVNNDFDNDRVLKAIRKLKPKLIYIQRSRGYSLRNALTIQQIENIIKIIRSVSKAYIVVDNCYGEFVENREPSEVGADIVMGSMIKNIGGGSIG